MRPLSILLGLLLAVGCTDDADGLDPGDAGAATDAGPRADAGAPADAGVVPGDAGVGADAGANLCGDAPPFQLTVVGESLVTNGYEGPITRLPGGTLFFQPQGDVGGEITLLGALPADRLTADAYWAAVEAYRPFWTEARVTLWTLTLAGTRGELVFVGWSGSQYGALDRDGIGYAYRADDCVAQAACGTAEGRTLEVRTAEERLVAPFGTQVDGPNFSAYNGGSSEYTDGPICPDTPAAWYEGWVAFDVDDTPAPCALMARDACIAASRCVLWGSEIQDPAYRCVDASNDCERIADPDACNGTATCSWDTGACYCPEGVECACAGGPAPKCRSNCGGFTGGDCGPDRYCDLAGLTPPDDCGPIPDGAGVCEWVPDDCGGTPNGPTCACGAMGAQSFANDCERRAARASGPIMGACL